MKQAFIKFLLCFKVILVKVQVSAAVFMIAFSCRFDTCSLKQSINCEKVFFTVFRRLLVQ